MSLESTDNKPEPRRTPSAEVPVRGDDGNHGSPAPAAADEPRSSIAFTLTSGRRYELESGSAADHVIVRGRAGEIVLRIDITDTGPVFSLLDAERPISRRGPWEISESFVRAASEARESSSSCAPPERTSSMLPREVIVPPPGGSDPPFASADPSGASPAVPGPTPLPKIRHPETEPPPYHEMGAPAAPTRVEPVAGRVRDSAFISDPPARTIATPRPDPPRPASTEPTSSRRALPSLTLPQYAALCAESAVASGPSFEQALERHGIANREAWLAIDRSWQERLAREPMLTLRWMELTTRYREHLTRR